MNFGATSGQGHYDGTAAALVADISPGAESSILRELTAVGGTLFFRPESRVEFTDESGEDYFTSISTWTVTVSTIALI